MMLLAIKGLHITPEIEKTENLINFNLIEAPSNLKFYGKFSQEGDLYMTEEDVESATTEFKVLVHNRLLHESE